MDFIRAFRPIKTFSDHWGFKKHWRSAHYYTGDVYQDELQRRKREDWEIKPENAGPYLRYIQTISSEWPQLRLLADFMEVGTDPLRWRNFYGDDEKNRYTYPDDPEERQKAQSNRVDKTRVRQLEYSSDGGVKLVGEYKNPKELGDALKALGKRRGGEDSVGTDVKLKLFVAEDLSREVIEQLGHHFDIDPDFFRAHIFDYAWFNIRDPAWNPPSLHMDVTSRDWYQIRFCRARYFPSQALFSQAQDEANKFNIGRKLYEDENKAFWDIDVPPKLVKKQPPPELKPIEYLRSWTTVLGAPVPKKRGPDEETPPDGSRRSSPEKDKRVDAELKRLEEEEIIGKVGLMRTRATFWKKKWEGDCDVGVLLLDPTIKEGFPLWRGYRNWDPIPSEKSSDRHNSCVPSLTRSKSEVEASFFEDFMYWAQRPNVFKPPSSSAPDMNRVPELALLRLVCAEWLTLSEYIKTRLSQIDWEVTHPKEFLTQTQIDTILKKLHTWRRLVPLYREMLSETKSRLSHATSPSPKVSASTGPDLLTAYKDEFGLVLEQMEEYEKRIDRLTGVVTSAISIMDSRRVERLTLLATLFVPLSLVASLFSMSEDITEIGVTFGYWAAASLFLLIVLLLWAWLTGSQSHRK
ncbi:hypothetical protein EKO27_g3490 [Xylaria grammica]|uniref:Uncharacterized protein n=1 Tax=Xylaria grammica TaxID=363999 RepID=A0A439DAZ8_9PEZI|nr:hypothetical protein EKO27_g3490 [Xylaria grammica]